MEFQFYTDRKPYIMLIRGLCKIGANTLIVVEGSENKNVK